MSGIMSMVLGAKTAIAAAVDAYFNLVTLLLPGDGTNGAQNNTFIDSSTNNFTITRNGNTTQGTFSPFSQTGWSNYFDGTGDYLTGPNASGGDFSTGSFTISCWFYPTTLSSGTDYGVLAYADASGWNGWQLLARGTTKDMKFEFLSGSAGVSTITGGTITLNAWNYVVVVRSGSAVNLYVNSTTSAASATNSSAYGVSTSKVVIGADRLSSSAFAGYISNVKLVKQANTPSSIPTVPDTNTTNTSLLTCQSNRFIDNSSNAFAITRNGDTSVQAFSPFAPTAAYSAATVGGSGYFDGNGDYLSIANTANLQFGSGDFTLEFFVYFNALSGNQTIYDKGYTGTNAFVIQTNTNTGTMIVYANGTAIITASSASPVGQWDHYAVVRSGTTITLYRNGVSVGSATNSVNFNNAAVTNIGAGLNQTNSTYTAFANAYISNVRLVKGSAVYTAPFTPPTAPHTAITNTQLLLNFTNGGIIDATGKNVLETVGNAQISTTQSKFGGSSMYFDGTGDRLLAATSPLYDLGSGNWTVECWVYASNLSSMRGVFAKRGNADGEVRWINAAINTNGTIYTEIATSSSAWGIQASTTTAISATTWAHIAWVRNGSDVSVYVNGTKNTLSSSFTSSVYNGTEPFVLGANGTSGSTYFYQMNGYIDDFRITRGYARYTATFTPPTEAFALQ